MLSHFLYFSMAIGYISAQYTTVPPVDTSCTKDGEYTRQAFSCENSVSDAFCDIFQPAVPFAAGGERNPSCYQDNGVASSDVKQGAIATCAKTCGYCCETPEYNCANENADDNCDAVTEEQCKDIKWREFLAVNCPATCGFCSEGPQDECPDGKQPMGPSINGVCPYGLTSRGTICCGRETPSIFAAPCIAEVQLGPCSINSSIGETCGGRYGYACNTGATGAAPGELTCCPTVDYTNDENIIGPAILGPNGVTYECMVDYTAVMVNGEQQCVSLSSTPGLCDAIVQTGPCIDSRCPGSSVCNVYAQVCCPDECVDLASGCANDLTICRNIHHLVFAMKNCKKTCGYCDLPANSGEANTALESARE